MFADIAEFATLCRTLDLPLGSFAVHLTAAQAAMISNHPAGLIGTELYGIKIASVDAAKNHIVIIYMGG